MRKLSCFFMAVLTLVSIRAYAQDAVLSLSGDIISEKKVPSKEDSKKEAEAEKSKTSGKKADKGVFSFMSVFDKKPKTEVKVESGPQETALEKLIRTAQEGDLNSQMSLGYMYLYGEDGVDVDYKKAFKYYKMAADQNDNVAVNNLGSLYFSGIGTPRNPEVAAQMFAKASELGNIEASVNLAFLYLSGQGVERNYRQAVNMFTKAAEADNPTASFMLGYAYFKGFVVKKDLRHAFELVRKGANAGYDDAQYVLAQMYVNGWGIPQNYGKAMTALNLASLQGHIGAMVEMANTLMIGDKYPMDIYSAHIWFNVASVLGAEGAAEMRDQLKPRLKIEDLLQAQAEAGKYKENPSQLTIYINQTFGENIKGYIDEGLKEQAKRTGANKRK